MTDRPRAATSIEERPEADQTPEAVEDLVLEELLVEEVSIDGMCGVY